MIIQIGMNIDEYEEIFKQVRNRANGILKRLSVVKSLMWTIMVSRGRRIENSGLAMTNNVQERSLSHSIHFSS